VSRAAAALGCGGRRRVLGLSGALARASPSPAHDLRIAPPPTT